jgi:hypothetical protein
MKYYLSFAMLVCNNGSEKAIPVETLSITLDELVGEFDDPGLSRLLQRIRSLVGKKGAGLDKDARERTFVDFVMTRTLILEESGKLLYQLRYEDAYDHACKRLCLL